MKTIGFRNLSGFLMISWISMTLGAYGENAHSQGKSAGKPNIIIILADDMGYGDAGFNGCTEIPTPHIDRIAASGVRFTDGYVTSPQCAPSRVGLLSGIAQNRFRCDSNDDVDYHGVPAGVRLFGDYLKLGGYKTGIVGKWHLGAMEKAHPLNRGFDSFFGFLGSGSRYFLPQGNKSPIVNGRETVKVTGYLTSVFGDQAARFIEESKDEPFFLYLSFNAPHAPLEAPDDYLEKFKHLAVEGEPGVMCAYTKRHIRHPRQVYAAMVSAMDDAIGRVMASLAANGLEENSLVVFLSDNGAPTHVNYGSNAPLRGFKGDLLEGGIRVPFALQWKAVVPPGQTVTMPVSSLDLLPTAMAAANIRKPDDVDLDGINMLPYLTGKKQPEARTLTWRFPFPPQEVDTYVWAVRKDDWKLVREKIGADDPQIALGKTRTGLYHMRDDIGEKNDLSDVNTKKRGELQSIHDAWNDTLPVPRTEDRSRR
jgi:arylsulfatase A-like enzyme